MKNWIAILLFTIFISGCNFETDKDLGNGYLFYHGDHYSTCIIDSTNTEMVPSEILDYAFDSVFVIASQRPYWDIPDVKGLDSMTLREHEKAFENSTFKQYWIINKKEKQIYSYDSTNKRAKYSNVYGPFAKETYLQKRKELGVPKELQLEKK